MIFGMNATAYHHDRVMNSSFVQRLNPIAKSVTNVVTMLPSAMISYSAIIGNNLRRWHRNALTWNYVRDDEH